MVYRYVEREGAESTRVTNFFGEGIRRQLKPSLLRVCNDQGSRFISTQEHLRPICVREPDGPG